MEKPALLILLLCLGGISFVVHADILDDVDSLDVRGPEPLTKRLKRSVHNLYDCPPSWTRVGPSMPSMPCPPGTSRYVFGGPPYSPHSFSPCPPWVDSEGRCHIRDRVYDGTRCRNNYGEGIYAQWQANRFLSRQAQMPGTPAPPCRSMSGP